MKMLLPMEFNLLCDRDQWGGVLRRIKNDHFLVFFNPLGLSPKFLGRLRGGLYYNRMK